MHDNNNVIDAIHGYWKHKLFVSYMRLRHHPLKTRTSKAFKKLLGLDDVIAFTSSGVCLSLNPVDYVQLELLRNGVFEPKTIELLKKLLPSSGTFLDVGGHIGCFALEAANAMESGQVIVVEPNPKTFTYLLKNIELNKFRNIIPILAAASNRNSILKMKLPPVNNWGMSRESLSSDDEFTYYVVSHKLSDLLCGMNINHVDVMKIDVEGHEIEALEGLFNYCQPANIIFEFVPEAFKYSYKLLEFVTANGYRIYNVLGSEYKLGDVIPEQNLWARRD